MTFGGDSSFLSNHEQEVQKFYAWQEKELAALQAELDETLKGFQLHSVTTKAEEEKNKLVSEVNHCKIKVADLENHLKKQKKKVRLQEDQLRTCRSNTNKLDERIKGLEEELGELSVARQEAGEEAEKSKAYFNFKLSSFKRGLRFYKQNLGLHVNLPEEDRACVTFHNILPENPNKKFTVELEKNDGKWKAVTKIDTVAKCKKTFPESENVFEVLREVRKWLEDAAA